MSKVQVCAVHLDVNVTTNKGIWEHSCLESILRGTVLPVFGKTFLNGGAADVVMESMRTKAVKRGLAITFTDVVVEIGRWHRKPFQFSDLEESYFFNAHRTSSDLQVFLAGFWSERIGDMPMIRDNWPKGPTGYPHVLDDLYLEEAFSHLKAIAYSIRTAEFGSVSVVTVFDANSISIEGRV